MVYDCFPFFNELEVLEIRLNTLKDVVDKHVLVESDRTFSNKPKPFYFEENKERFAPFLNKIIHIKLTEYPAVTSDWVIENYQRNMIVNGLQTCSPDDVIMISDLDEIPNPEAVRQYDGNGIKTFEQAIYIGFLNYRSIVYKKWYGTNILRYRDLSTNGISGHKFSYSKTLLPEINEGATPTKIRMIRDFPIIKNGGWHFTYMGGVQRIQYKINSFAHQEYNSGEYTSTESIERKIKKGYDLIHPGENRCIPVALSNDFPKYIVDNEDKFSHIIYPVTRLTVIRNIYIYVETKFRFYFWHVPYKTLRKIRKSLFCKK